MATRASRSSTSTRSSLTPPAVEPIEPPAIMATISTSSDALPSAATGESLKPAVVCAETPSTAARRSACRQGRSSPNTKSVVSTATTSTSATASARSSALRHSAPGPACQAR